MNRSSRSDARASVGSTAFLGVAVHQIYALAAARRGPRALGKVNGVEIGPQA